MRVNLPDKTYFLGKTLPFRSDTQILGLLGSGNNAHVFRAHSAELGRDVACKVIPRANLIGADRVPPTWRAEVLKANRLQTPAAVKFFEIGEWRDGKNSIDCVVLISDYVEGKTLRSFVASNKDEVTVTFAAGFLKSMLDFFFDMISKGVVHGDLHSGNVLVADRSSYSLAGERYEFRITDFGVTTATSDTSLRDDFFQLAVMLKEILEAVDYQSASPKDKFAFNVLNDHFLAKHLVERDATLDPLARHPRKLFDRLMGIDADFEKAQAQDIPQLITPFDYLSCEQIGEAHSILRALYSDLFLGLTDIEARNNLVLTGPRGCGKSTVFKSLSLRHRHSIGESSPERITYVGIYYRCDDLYFAFPRYNRPNRQDALDLPIHFITSTLLADLLTVVEVWATSRFHDEFSGAESRVSREVWGALGLPPPSQPGANTFEAIVSRLQKERQRAARKHRFVKDVKQEFGQYFGAEVLAKVCQILAQAFSFLRERPFYFFIDDYSSPKITKELQENLNRVFMQRTSCCFFKLSTESPVSFSKSDIDNKIYVEGREFALVNLGLIYLHAEMPEKLQFIEDVFGRRLSAPPNYPVKELTLLIGGNAGLNHNEEARQIRQNRKLEFWGKETLCRLCSGDIHYLISLVRDMVASSGGISGISASGLEPKVPSAIQNKAIREAAGNFLKNLRGVPGHGDRLVEVVTAFGNVAHSFLRFRDSANESGRPPHQATRVEPYEALNLSSEAQRIYDDLLRYSVFIEDVRGKSRRGKVVPRLYLRRFLIPHFNLTLSLRDSVELEPREFELFLLNPQKFEDSFRLRGPEPPGGPGPLFDQGPEGQ
ncbi:MAG TPA: protein kinase [Terriglobia bacterium]|nr:protein kinase [Terriglobia bacterium]